ncbi:MAG: hypothetical protein ACYTX0_39685 [Nostoc sp.]
MDISQQCADASRATDTRLRVELESLLGTEYCGAGRLGLTILQLFSVK